MMNLYQFNILDPNNTKAAEIGVTYCKIEWGKMGQWGRMGQSR